MDSTLIAYVAEALEDMDHALDYDTAADQAARLLAASRSLREAAEAYGHRAISAGEFGDCVFAAQQETK
jgi:hypothetical protein